MINNITIVGGGSAGWMTATTLLNQFPDKKITLIESPNTPNIGVGESTVAGGQSGFSGITQWLNLVDINVSDFMPHTDAIFKLSIAFENWYRKDSGTFHFPFGAPLFQSERGLDTWYCKKIFHPETPVSDFADCFWPGMALVNQNKSLFSNDNISVERFESYINGHVSNLPEFEQDELNHEVQKHSRYSLQFDATKFGIWLRDNYCKIKYPNNFTHIVAEVKEIPLNDNGIEYLVLDNGQKLEADLFIDCTGFKSLLLSKTFNVPFIPFEQYIPNNYAWATKIPYKDPETQIVNYTKCTAIENGWIWEIPLWSRMGSGYVFSDKFISTQAALREFKQGLRKKGYENVEDLEYHLIPMRSGIQSKLWVKNTCAIGLSAGFIEPLQSNGLQCIIHFIFNLTSILSRGHISEWDRREFTAKCQFEFNAYAASVSIPYALSHRDDTEYWREIQNREYPAELFSNNSEGILFHLYNKFIIKNFQHQFDPQDRGMMCMATGMNWNPIDFPTLKYTGNWGNIEDVKINTEKIFQHNIEERKRRWNEQVKDHPSPYQYLRDNIHNG